ncbi:MAG: 3,4-dehydroadipyl-CoA semialdehyde dehydrogenase [Deltaproteobacteria bacterium]|nr:3,4-dehydroadipyl-CoA semialdehyde dehydrogenase [Deltaproteobacteria bacterium]
MSTERIQSYVGGVWHPGMGEGAPLVNPTTEAELARADTSGVDMALALTFARREGGGALRAMTFAQRAGMVGKMSSALHKAREALIETSVANGGCTRSDAKFDVDGAIGTLAAYAELGQTLGDVRVLADGEGVQLGRSPRFWGQHIYTPRVGAAVLINAFNFPAWGFAEKAACALLAGMPVVCKPATATALTAYRMFQAIVESGEVPKGAVSFIGGAPQDLLDHLDWQDLVAFTGSANTGRALRSRPNIVAKSIPVNVEADSLNATVLGPDVSIGDETLSLFLREISKDLTQKTGQKCTAVRRIVLPEAIAADVEAELASRLADIKIGDPANNEVGMGPLATRAQLEDVKKGVERLAEDAEVIFGDPAKLPALIGVEPGRGFFHPILLLRARSSLDASNVHSHEVFGPVATLCRYSGAPEQAAEIVTRGAGGLVASVYSDDRAFLERAVAEMAPYHGRIYLGGSKVVDHTLGPGTVLPHSVHGGPGRAGGGEELGGLRGVKHFMQRTALQGYRPTVEALAGVK